MINAEQLRELLTYDPLTGEFRWRVRNGYRVVVGAVAGCVVAEGYRIVGLDGRRYKAHQLAWFYVHEVWPTHEIDHVNGIGSDNRLANLRDDTHQRNSENRTRPNRNNRSGYLGVSRKKGRWIATITVDGVRRWLGYFATPEQASEAYQQAKRRVELERRNESA